VIGWPSSPRAIHHLFQASEMELDVMRYELTDYEWLVIKPLLPNKLGAYRD
jgi:hypothetical protein